MLAGCSLRFVCVTEKDKNADKAEQLVSRHLLAGSLWHCSSSLASILGMCVAFNITYDVSSGMHHLTVAPSPFVTGC